MAIITPLKKIFNWQLASEKIQQLPYKVYTALLTQTGTDAPVATVLENTLGDIVWSRVNVGVYLGTLNGAFLSDKTFIPTNPNGGIYGMSLTKLVADGTGYFQIYRGNTNQVELAFFSNDTGTTPIEMSTVTAGQLAIEIRVYN